MNAVQLIWVHNSISQSGPLVFYSIHVLRYSLSAGSQFITKRYAEMRGFRWEIRRLNGWISWLVVALCHFIEFSHNSDTTWASWCLKSPASRLFVQKFVEVHNRYQHQCYVLLTICEGNPSETSWFPSRMPSNGNHDESCLSLTSYICHSRTVCNILL